MTSSQWFRGENKRERHTAKIFTIRKSVLSGSGLTVVASTGHRDWPPPPLSLNGSRDDDGQIMIIIERENCLYREPSRCCCVYFVFFFFLKITSARSRSVQVVHVQAHGWRQSLYVLYMPDVVGFDSRCVDYTNCSNRRTKIVTCFFFVCFFFFFLRGFTLRIRSSIDCLLASAFVRQHRTVG